MKKILLIAALTLCTGLAMAQTKSMDGYMMKDGKVMMMKEGKTTQVEADVTLSDGTKIMKDGNVMKKDGTKMMMKNGESMDTNGMMRK